MPPVEQPLGVTQQEPTDFGRLAAPIDHRLKIPIEVRPAKLPTPDPNVAAEPIADDHLPAVGPEQVPGDLGPPGGGDGEDRHQVRHGDPEPRLSRPCFHEVSSMWAVAAPRTSSRSPSTGASNSLAPCRSDRQIMPAEMDSPSRSKANRWIGRLPRR